MSNKENNINGLVLAGGKSTRMGRDKGSIEWHGKEQQYYIADLLMTLCNEVFISKRIAEEQTNNNYEILTDTYTGIGPYGAILSAFKFNPTIAWLVVACDLPLLDKKTLEYLIKNRNLNSIATTFHSPHDNLPEPLITIWEPKSFSVLLSYLDNGFTCPRKVLIKNDNVHIIQPQNADALMNVNTPEDFTQAENIINKEKQLHNAR
jgi:molybdopterin-guanine dinucleotide biosynthesis protein A